MLLQNYGQQDTICLKGIINFSTLYLLRTFKYLCPDEPSLCSMQRIGRSFFSGSVIRSQSFCQKWICNPIQSFYHPEKGSAIRSNPILCDPFRSDPYRLCLKAFLFFTIQNQSKVLKKINRKFQIIF